MKTRVIVGLGNPGLQYEQSPHNIGFRVIDSLVPEMYLVGKTISIRNEKTYWAGIYEYKNTKVYLIKPLRFMNLSGTGLTEALIGLGLSKINLANEILIIHDELDIDSGSIKVVEKGNPGNNNGCKNIDEVLDLQGEWQRIKVGAKPLEAPKDKVSYVIGKMSTEQSDVITKGEKKTKAAVLKWLESDITATMSQFNQKGPNDSSKRTKKSKEVLPDAKTEKDKS